MEKNRFLKIIIIALLVLNFGTLTFMFFWHHSGKHHHNPHGEEGPAKFIVEELGFDEKQRKQFNELKKEHQHQMHAIQDSMRIQREVLPDIIISENTAKADSVAGLIGGYQKQIEFFTYQHFVKVRSICNEEQKNKFKTIITDILHQMGHRNGPPH